VCKKVPMKRIAFSLLGTALGTCAVAQAQDRPPDYPKKPIRIIIGIAPGGGLDNMTRLGAQKLIERWGKSVNLECYPVRHERYLRSCG
jgi:tripartite-type tricarboxylate transporter receptor subunit TctC